MKRRELERHLGGHDCWLHEHGGRHDIWLNPRTGARVPVPRHATLKRGTVRAICRILGVPLPRGM